MALPAPNLDDRTFQDIVDEAKRLIPRYTPEWTNHNLSDPGVALIELFAWMSEMVLYRVNQVPDRLYVHFLNLVGIDPFPPSVARADVTFWLSAAQDAVVTVPEGTQITTARDTMAERAIVFTTVDRLDIRPPELVAAITTDARTERLTDVIDDLRYEGSSVTCFNTVDRYQGPRAGRRAAARFRPVAGRDGHPAVRLGGRQGHRGGPAASTAGLGGVERRGLDRGGRVHRHHRWAQPLR
ncbi:MAG: hypothetical protein U0R72_13380 [Nakamurella multipartita]